MKNHIRTLLQGLLIFCLILPLNFTRVHSAPNFDCATVVEIPETECAALVAIYLSTNGDQWTNHTNWLSNTTPSSWAKVSVLDGHVKALYLINNNLVGTIPVEIGDLTELTYLDMGGNQLSGTIPASLGNLTLLTDLYLWANQLSGPIPPELGNLSSLRNLSFWNNRLTGTIPASLGGLTEMRELAISQNLISGTIPVSLASLSNLKVLALYDNALTGSIPPELGNLSQLTGLYLSANQLSGSIPASLGNLTHLQFLELTANQLSGEVPAQLWTLTELIRISLRGNHLTGSIPTEIGNLTKLNLIDFRFNSFSGSIPGSIGNLTQLTKLLLGSNQFSGPIPAEIGNLTNLTVLALHNNQLSGPIPAQLANLTNLAAPGQGGWGMDGLALEYNHLSVPDPYPSNPPTALDSFLMEKDPDWHETQPVEASVSTGGGQITSNDSTSTVTIPPSAVTETTTITFIPQPGPSESTGSLNFANHSFQMTALDSEGNPLESFSFEEPVTVTLQYQDADVESLYEASLKLYYWDTASQSWMDSSTTCNPNTTYQRDLDNNTLSIGISHFTEFAMLGGLEQKVYLPAVAR